ncbi:MAG: CDP-alcohol phosphatidyltransferase family protein [Rhizobiales bacterium]|nr:CDP-alcohol phosphatidyltransferase family protein [Hyphomicrobiales bacterium]
MASIYDIKPKFQALLRPVCRWLAAAGFTANQVTIIAAALSIAHGLALCWQPGRAIWLLLLPVTLFIRMALNAIDGMLAREHGQKSRLGAILNELCDAISDTALYLPFALIPGLSPTAAVLAAILAVLTEMTGVLGPTVGSTRRYDGPMGKSDRAFAFGLLAALIAFTPFPAEWAVAYQWVIVGLLVVTVCNRAAKVLAGGEAK